MVTHTPSEFLHPEDPPPGGDDATQIDAMGMEVGWLERRQQLVLKVRGPEGLIDTEGEVLLDDVLPEERNAASLIAEALAHAANAGLDWEPMARRILVRMAYVASQARVSLAHGRYEPAGVEIRQSLDVVYRWNVVPVSLKSQLENRDAPLTKAQLEIHPQRYCGPAREIDSLSRAVSR